MVKTELGAALEEMGIETTKELDLVIQIKGEVRKLGTQSNIIDQLGALEQREMIEKHEKRLLPEIAAAGNDDVTSGTPSSNSQDSSSENSVLNSRKNSESRLEEFKSFSQSLSQSLAEKDWRGGKKEGEGEGGGEGGEGEGGGNTPTLAPRGEEGEEEAAKGEVKEEEGKREDKQVDEEAAVSVATDEDQTSSLCSDEKEEEVRAPMEKTTPTTTTTTTPPSAGNDAVQDSPVFREEAETKKAVHPTHGTGRVNTTPTHDDDDGEEDQRHEFDGRVPENRDVETEPLSPSLDKNPQDANDGKMTFDMGADDDDDDSVSQYPESILDEAETARTAIGEEASFRTPSPPPPDEQ